MPNADKRRDLRAYRNKVTAAKNKAKRQSARGIPTRCYWCMEVIDPHLPAQHGDSLTLDHPTALVDGGHITNQALVPMHRRCNAAKYHAERRAQREQDERNAPLW